MYNTCSAHGKVSHVLLHGRRHDVKVDLATFETYFLLRLLLPLLFLPQLHMRMMMIMMMMIMMMMIMMMMIIIIIIIIIVIIQNHS